VFEPTVGEVELFGSPGRLTQVLTNLLTNAVEASRDHGGPITVRLAPDPRGIELSVSDQGRGIAPENLSRIFDPLFTTKFGENTGMGLTIVHDIVISEFSGTIEAESEVGQGTTFTIWLPRPPEISEA
jgi:signal transduction histidine kinase